MATMAVKSLIATGTKLWLDSVGPPLVKAHFALVVAGGLALALPLVGPARAADWPQWGGADPGRNMVSSETNLPDTFVPGTSNNSGGIETGSSKNVRWRVPVGSAIYGNPTVAGGKVFLGTTGTGGRTLTYPTPRPVPEGRALCLNEATGELLWELRIPKTSPTRGTNSHLSQVKWGVCSAPAVDGDRVYVLTGSGLLLCLTTDGLAAGNQGPFQDEAQFIAGEDAEPVKTLPTDADIVWVFDLIRELKVSIHDIASCSVLVHGPYLYLVTSNGVGKDHVSHPASDAPSFIVIEKMTGRLVAVDDEKLGQRLFHCLWSPPSIGLVNGRSLVFFGGGDGVCYAFETPPVPDAKAGGKTNSVQKLKKVWSYDCVPAEYKTRAGQAINYREGDARKKAPFYTKDGTYAGPSEIIGTPVFYRNRVYVTLGQDPAHGRGRGMLHCIDATKYGEITKSGRVWAFDQIERSLSGVAIADGRLYVGDIAGHVFCLDPNTGRCYWKYNLQAETWSTPLVADRKVYIGSVKGIHILAAGPEAKELARIYLGSPSHGSVVAANGTLFISNSKYLWAVQQGAVLKQLDGDGAIQ